MRLLVVTQTVDLDDPVLGFFHAWLMELAERCERVEVVCLRAGKHALPANVRVHSLGKECGAVSSFRYALRFYARLFQLRGTYDAVFVHMNPEYVVLAGWLWRLTGTRIVLWYVHKNVDLKLRIAALFANALATSSPESLRLTSSKKAIVGHGIDAAAYSFAQPLDRTHPRLLSVGRISPTKNQLRVLEAFKQVQMSIPGATLTFAGAPATKADHAYAANLQAEAERSGGAVALLGPIAPAQMPALYRAHGLLLHASDTGSLDRVVLEALASGLRVVSTSEAFSGSTLSVIHVPNDAHSMAEATLRSLEAPWDANRAREQVAMQHDLSALIGKLIALLSGSKVV